MNQITIDATLLAEVSQVTEGVESFELQGAAATLLNQYDIVVSQPVFVEALKTMELHIASGVMDVASASMLTVRKVAVQQMAQFLARESVTVDGMSDETLSAVMTIYTETEFGLSDCIMMAHAAMGTPMISRNRALVEYFRSEMPQELAGNISYLEGDPENDELDVEDPEAEGAIEATVGGLNRIPA